MSDGEFTLRPFPTAGSTTDLRITGNIARRSNTLTLRYVLLGNLAALKIAPPARTPSRRVGLWEETCFELFLAVRGCPEYWEFNLAPSRNWNVYRFAAYRQGMQEEAAFAALPFRLERQKDSLSLVLELNLDKIIPADVTLEVAISAVIARNIGEATYWALAHPGPQPDFHRRDGFILER